MRIPSLLLPAFCVPTAGTTPATSPPTQVNPGVVSPPIARAAQPPPLAPTAPAEPQTRRPVVYRFTVKGDNLYAIAQSWPGDTATITSLATGRGLEGKITSVTLLGHSGNLQFTQDAEGLKVKLPADRPCNYAFALKITGLKMNPAGPPVPAVMADLR